MIKYYIYNSELMCIGFNQKNLKYQFYDQMGLILIYFWKHLTVFIKIIKIAITAMCVYVCVWGREREREQYSLKKTGRLSIDLHARSSLYLRVPLSTVINLKLATACTPL